MLRQLPPSQPAPCYSEITTRAKTPTSCEIPTRKMTVVPLNRKNHLKYVGGTFVTYPTFRTSACLSHGSPLPSHPPTHSYTKAAKTRNETPHPASSATQPEPLPRQRRPQQHLDVPHPPYRMRIRRRSHRTGCSATPSSTSQEQPRRSTRLSCHLHSHTAVFTCTTGRASSSPFPPMKLRPNRRHQRGCTLITAFSS